MTRRDFQDFPGEQRRRGWKNVAMAVWLYCRFPLSLRMVEEMLAARGVEGTYETVRRRPRKFGQNYAWPIRALGLAKGDKWHLDEMVVKINERKH